jgi:hypothetical protein
MAKKPAIEADAVTAVRARPKEKKEGATPKKTKSENWKGFLVMAPGRKLAPCAANVALILTHDVEWEGVLVYDELVGDIVARRIPPWPADMKPAKCEPGDWTGDDTIRAGMWIARNYGFTPTTRTVGEGLRIVAMRTLVHPIRDWVKSLRWDKKKRIDTMFIRLGGAEDTPLNRAISKNFLISCIARVMVPGAKVDTMPILEGEQGLGKSSLLRALVGEQWFIEGSVDIGTKDGYQMLRRKWVGELGELDSLSRAEVSGVKQFLSQRVDTYRPSYGTHAVDFPRQIVFAGTVNPDGGGYLKDDTGARRFWPIFLTLVDLAGLLEQREQLWAEAYARYMKGEKWYIDDPVLIAAAAESTEERRQADPWEQVVGGWIAANPSVRRRGVTTVDVLKLALEIPVDRLGRTEESRIGKVLRTCGFGRTARERRGGVRTRIYYPTVELADVGGGKAELAQKDPKPVERGPYAPLTERLKSMQPATTSEPPSEKTVDSVDPGRTEKSKNIEE